MCNQSGNRRPRWQLMGQIGRIRSKYRLREGRASHVVTRARPALFAILGLGRVSAKRRARIDPPARTIAFRAPHPRGWPTSSAPRCSCSQISTAAHSSAEPCYHRRRTPSKSPAATNTLSGHDCQNGGSWPGSHPATPYESLPRSLPRRSRQFSKSISPRFFILHNPHSLFIIC